MGSSKDMWHATCHAFAFAAPSREEGFARDEQHVFGCKMSVQSDDDRHMWADQTFTTLDTSIEDDDRLDDDVFDSSAASDGSNWRFETVEAADDDVRTAEAWQSSSSHDWRQGNGQVHWDSRWSSSHAKQPWWANRRAWDSWSSSGGGQHRSSNTGASGSARRYTVKKGRDARNCRNSWWMSERWAK